MNQVEHYNYHTAKSDPEYLTLSSKNRKPQYAAKNGGENIILGQGIYGGEAAESLHAILFAGNTYNRPGYWNDIVREFNMLTKSGFPEANITVLYGNGNPPSNAEEEADALGEHEIKEASREELETAINNLKTSMNAEHPNEQLYIYIGDHGSNGPSHKEEDVGPTDPGVPAKQNYFKLLDDDNKESLNSKDNTSGPYLSLHIEREGEGVIPDGYGVYFNYQYMTDIPAGNTSEEMEIPLGHAQVWEYAYNRISYVNYDSLDPNILVSTTLVMGDMNIPYYTLPPNKDGPWPMIWTYDDCFGYYCF